jgi:hypothetical protein
MQANTTTSATFELDLPELIKRMIDLAMPRADDIMSSPAKLGELLTICAQFAEIEPIVRERAATLALEHHEIPGWTLVHRDGNAYVETEEIARLTAYCPLSYLPSLVSTMVQLLANISEKKYRSLCESAGLEPALEAIKQSGAKVSLRRNSSTQTQES